ncbi:MAG: hypothetical protein IKS55_01170 [Oscillospiraceae bacterium]|nr:hypothetical protein [Oscillospiraceae bacterium]
MDTFCIPIKVEDEKDLYEPFLPSALAFSGELTAYLEDYLEDRKLGNGVILELQASQPPDMDHFRNAYHAFIEKLIRRNNKAIRLADLKAVLFLLLGMAFVSIGLALAGRVDSIGAEIISAIGSFAMWGAAASFIETLPTLRVEKKRLEIFSKAEIRYKAL